MTYIPSGGKVSTLNSTTNTLGASATFTGEWEDVANFGSITVITAADQNGTLFAEFSTDGVSVSRTLQLSTGNDNTFGIHALIPVTQYFRVRFVNGSVAQGSFDIQVIYTSAARIAQPTSRLNQTLSDYSDVLNTRAIIGGLGGTNNATVTDHNALQVTFPQEGKTAFGETMVSSLSQIVSSDFVYGINNRKLYSRANQSGTVTASGGNGVFSTGSAANSSGYIVTQDKVRYQPGRGSRARFTALFTTGVANSTQIAGIGDESNGFFFGYNGADFGILHRSGGSPEIRTLTITTASTTAETITITLDGNAKSDVVVTNSNNTTTTANEIAAADYSDVGRGWDTYAVASTVIFVSWDASSRTGTYSLSGATTAVGTFAQTVAGVAPTETWVNQADWNGIDIFDGNGLSGVTLDPTQGNVYQIVYQWLGYGAIYFFLEDPDDGEYHNVHTISFANANTAPSLEDPNCPITIGAENFGNTSNLSVRSASLSGFIDGAGRPSSELLGSRFSISASTVLTGTADETPSVSIRNSVVQGGRKNNRTVKGLILNTSVEHTKAVQVKFYSGATLTNASFSPVSDTGVEFDTAATAFSGGTEILSVSLGKTGNETILLNDDYFSLLLQPGDVITATILPNSGTGAEGNVSIVLSELL